MKKEILHSLILNAAECENFELFCAECGGALPAHYDDEKAISALSMIWTFHKSPTFRTVRALSDLSQKRYSDTYGISIRTVEDWESEKRKPTEYLLELLLADILD